MKDKTKNILNSLVLLFLLVGLIIPADAGYNVDYSHGNEAIESDNIQIRESTFFDKLFSSLGPFAIYANSGTYQPGQTAIFTYETTSWNLVCLSATEVVELYGPDGLIQSFSRGGLGPLYSNKAFSGSFSYSIPSNAKAGSYALAEYLQCNDFSYPTLYPSNYNNYQRKISTAGSTQFVIGQPLPDCTIWNTVIDWGTCNQGRQSRQVSNLCGDTRTEFRDCTIPGCTPNWQCSDYGQCTNNQQIRGCQDSNNCGSSSGKPSEVQDCSSGTNTCTNEATNYPACDNQNLPREKSKTLTIAGLKNLLDSTDAQQAQDFPKLFCNIKEDCDSEDAQCITIGKASSTQSIADVFIPGSIENTIVNVFKAVYKLTTVEAQINKYNTNNAQGLCLSDFSSVTCADENCNQIIDIQLHPGIDPVDADGSTTEDLISSSCTKTEQCESDSVCKSLDWYTKNDYLTKDDAQQKINDARIKLTGTTLGAGAGAIGGVLGAAALVTACSVGTVASFGALAPVCFGVLGIGAIAGGIAGSQIGGYIADITNAIASKDTSALGYCTLKSSLPDTSSFFNKTLFDLGTFHVTGLYLIIGIGLLLVLLSLRKN